MHVALNAGPCGSLTTGGYRFACEVNDLAAVTRYMGTWNPYLDIQITPVLDDEEAVAAMGQIVTDNNA